MSNEPTYFSHEANEMHAGAADYAERAEVLAEIAREDEQAEGWRMLGVERPAHWES
jgi:hypothetical protein